MDAAEREQGARGSPGRPRAGVAAGGAPATRAARARAPVYEPPPRAVAIEPEPPPAAAATAATHCDGAQRESGRGWLLPVAIALAFAFALAGVGWLAYTNKTRADDWEARAFRLERNTEQLNGLLVERSTLLNERTREVNQIAKRFARQNTALTRSESDVETLTDRQRQLAAEKAALEDSRASLAIQATALDGVANELVACNDGLFELLGHMAQGNQAAVSALIDGVAADCDSAEQSFAEYRARYG